MQSQSGKGIMPFGMHKGKRFSQIPAQYLLWLFNKGCTHPEVSQYIHDNLASLQAEVSQQTQQRLNLKFRK